MYKVTYNLARINQYLSVDVTIFIQDDETLKLNNIKNKESLKTIKTYNIDGNTYIKFNPRPFIDLTIDPDQKDKYDPYKHIRCNRFDVFKLIKSLEKMVNNFKSITDLFYYYGDKLILDDSKIDKATIILPLKERTLKITPTLILDVDSGRQHEGVIIYVNTESVSCPLTYIEMEYLLYILNTIDIDSLASFLYIIDGNIQFKDKEENKDDVPKEVNIEKADDDNTISYATPQKGNTIPDI